MAGHGSNEHLCEFIARRATLETDALFASTIWTNLAVEAFEAVRDSGPGGAAHACELETSMILRIRPELVRMDLARGANIAFDSAFYSPDSSGPSRVSVARPFEHVTATGALSHPEVATPVKGERLYEVATHELVKFIREFQNWKTFEPA